MTDPTKEAERLANEKYPWRVQSPNPIPYQLEAYKAGYLKAWHLARASAFEECAKEAKRKYDKNEMPNVGHSAQSFGQQWAYSNIIEWAEERAKAEGK